ncbi:MAG TPA: serpin family protein [Blastocatellia bacterium]|nr:serpin family protein [Blastocatellia bacterium]
MTSLKNGVLTGAIVLSLIGCSSVSRSDEVEKAAPMEPPKTTADTNAPEASVDARLVAANNQFGFALYREILKRNSKPNVFASSSSVSLALAMVYNGAAGETKQAMARAMKLEGMSIEDVNRANAALKASLENPDPKVQLQIANSLWARQDVTFKPDFIARNKEFYGAEVTSLDFGKPEAANTINSWVKSKTNSKIDKIVDNIDANTILFLINAIYFNGKWTEEFNKARTVPSPFKTPGGEKQHPLMSQSGKYSYYEDQKFQAVSLPYGNKRVSMYIFLPAEGSSLAEFHSQLTAENWQSWMSRFTPTDGDIMIPRFKMEYEIELNDALKALGMGPAFDPGAADFTNMLQSSERAYIRKVKHKTFVEVNEEGTEAAAVTSAEIAITSARRPPKRFSMVVDRPFFCAIRDNQTGSLLFMGSITDPT